MDTKTETHKKMIIKIDQHFNINIRGLKRRATDIGIPLPEAGQFHIKRLIPIYVL